MVDEVKVKFGADHSVFNADMSTITASFKSSVDEMKNHMKSLKGGLEEIKGVFVAVTALLAGGALFSDAIKSTIALSGEVTALSKKLGITREEASILDVALKHIGATSEDYIGVVTHMNRQLRTNEEGLKALGLQTRDANGEFKNQKDIIDEGLKLLLTYKEGTDRNLASMAMFGRGVDDVNKLLKMNASVMAEAKELTEAFGLVMGADTAAQAIKMKSALATVATAGEAIEVAIGKAAMPSFVALGDMIKNNAKPIMEGMTAVIQLLTTVIEALASVVSTALTAAFDIISEFGKIIMSNFGGEPLSAMEFFVNVMAVLKIGVLLLKEAFNTAFLVIRELVLDLLIPLRMLGEIAYAAFHLDWAGVQSAWAKGTGELERLQTESAKRIKAGWNKTAEDIDKAVNKATSKPEDAGRNAKPGYRSYDGKDKAGKDKDLAAARVALMMAEEQAAYAIKKDQLQQSQALYDQAYSKHLISIKDYYASQLVIAQEGLDAEINMKKNEIEKIKEQEAKSAGKGTPEGEKESLTFRAKLVKLTADLEIIESHRATAAINNNRAMMEAEEKLASSLKSIQIDQREKLSQDAISMDEADANLRYQMGVINNEQLLLLQKDFENRRNEAARAAIQERLQLEIGTNNDPVHVAELNAQLEELESQHQLKMRQIVNQGIVEANKPWLEVFKTLEQSFNSVLMGLLTKTMTMKQAMTSMLTSVGQTIIQEIITKPLAAKAVAWIREKFFGLSEVSKNAAVAGSGAASAVAGIPIVGPAMAAAVGPATYASTLAFGAGIMAEQGFDVPQGMNPMTQLHQKEMVLPAKHADVIRDLADGGGGGGDQFHLSISAIDQASVRNFFLNHKGQVADALKAAARDGKRK
jgi:hypothetical protein